MASTGILLPTEGLLCNSERKSAPDPSRFNNQNCLIEVFLWIRRLSQNKSGDCWAYNKMLATRLKLSSKTITRAVERLRLLDVVAVEQIIGIERRVRPLITLDELKIILFRGHKSNWTGPGKAEKVEAGQARSSAPAPQTTPPASSSSPIPDPSFCPPVVPGVVPTPVPGVVPGPKEVSATQIPSHSSYEEKTTTDIAPEALPKTLPPTEPTAPVVVPSPMASGDQPDPQLVALVAALGIPECQVPRLIAHKSAVTVGQAVGAVRFYLTRNSGNPGALLTVALRDGWTPPATAEHASDHGERPVHIVRSPREYLDRVAASALEAPRMPVEALVASTAGDSPSGGREAFRMAIRRLKSMA